MEYMTEHFDAFEFTFPGHLSDNQVVTILDDLVEFLDIDCTPGFRVDTDTFETEHRTDSDGYEYTTVIDRWEISGYTDRYDMVELVMHYDRDKAEQFIIEKYNDLDWDGVEIFENGPTFEWYNYL